MSTPPRDTVFDAALLEAMCDLVAVQVFETRAIAAVLLKKGVFSMPELDQSRTAYSHDAVEEVARDLSNTLQERLKMHLTRLGRPQD